jgi:hypothetical protein
MERFSRSGILIARVMISMVFLLNAFGAALALFAFLMTATLVSHSFWLSAGTPAFMGQLINFSKNLAILGGLLFVASAQSQPALSRSIYAKVRNGAVLTTARQPQP